jgi:hypothetical protein
MGSIVTGFRRLVRRFRRLVSRVIPGWAPSPVTPQDRLHQLEVTGRVEEAVVLAEQALSQGEITDIHPALARSHHILAMRGNEVHAWPALLAALDGIENRCQEQPEIVHLVDICRWVLEYLGDTHRIDVRGFYERLTDKLPNVGERPENGFSVGMESAGPALPGFSDLEALRQNGQHVQLGNALLSVAPVVLRLGRSKDWVAREVRWLFANVLSPLAGAKASELLAADNLPLSGGHEAQQYDRYLLTAARVRRQQLQAQSEGVPTIFLTALPKSASEFLSYTLAEVTGAAVVRVSVGDPLFGSVHAPWVATALAGGCITHDHFAASEQNLKSLREGNLEQIRVLIRDPRAVFWSYETMQAEWDGIPAAERRSPQETCRMVKVLANWIRSWMQAQQAGFPVTFLRFQDLTGDPAAVMGDLLQASGAGHFVGRLHKVLRQRREQKRMSSNMRRGDDHAWRDHIPSALHATLWDVIPAPVKELLELEP